ncbi:MAG: ATP-binding protein [[Clostridium] nexile]
MKQAKKIFTRILMNNWGGIDHQVLCLNEYVNLFSGKSGSGKSSVMDAMQVVLYGSVGNDFLNRAADDSANKRSVLSYLRESKRCTANRENQDFYAHIVLEIRYRAEKLHVSERFESEKMIWT